jgi:hypothetical protein
MAGERRVYRSRNIRNGAIAGGLVSAVPIIGLGARVTAERRAFDALLLVALVGVVTVLLWRVGRLGVVVGAGQVRVRNFTRTWTLPAAEVERFVVATNDGLPALMAYARLRDGRIVKLEGVGTSQFITAGERLSLRELVERLNTELRRGRPGARAG